MICSLKEVAQLTGGELRGDNGDFAGAGIDTRALQDGQLFFALKGENTDGHRFIGDALGKGAAAAMVEKFDDSSSLPQIKVASCMGALQQLAQEKRRGFYGAVIAITGSSGKTTTKEMLRSILSKMGPTLAPPHSYNNRLGVSLTLASLECRHRYAVLEIGASAPGEIAELAQLVQPRIALITNAGRAHLQGFGSVEGVAVEKGSLLNVLRYDGVAVLPADDRFFRSWMQRAANCNVVSYGRSELSDCRLVRMQESCEGTSIELDCGLGALRCGLGVSGLHNGTNAAGAAAVAIVLGARHSHLQSGLADVRPMNGRLTPLPGPKGSELYDDSYNANPDSVRSAIDFLAARRGRRILVLGDMGELGETAAQLHEGIGTYAQQKGIDELHAIGSMAEMTVGGFVRYASADAKASGTVHEALEPMVSILSNQLNEGVTALVKGSRSSRMERVIEMLQGTKQ